MADSPTPQQQESTKEEGGQLPEISRPDSRTSGKDDHSDKKPAAAAAASHSTKEATPRQDDTRNTDSRDERRGSQSESKDQTNAKSTTQATSHPASSPTQDTEPRTKPKPEPATNNKKKTRFEEEPKSPDKKQESGVKENNKNNQKENQQNENKNKSGVKGSNKENQSGSMASQNDNSSRKGNERKSPRKEKEGKSPRKGGDEENDIGGRKERREEEEEGEGEEESKGGKRSGELSSRSSNGCTEMSEGRCKQREFFKNELQRLESSLKRESSKIIEPQKKPHTPYIFNTLEPYYNTNMTRFLIELPDELKHGHTSRRTAQGLTDPWQDLKMDRDILPKVNSKPVSRQVAILKKEKEIRDRKKRSAMSQSGASRKEGSTRLPKFPMVQLETQDLAKKHLVYSDVPGLRTELKSKYSSSARTKIDEDYKRTQADFYRMELDKLDEVHPINRSHMRSAYFAYLQNTPGSKKAITECVRGLKSGKAQ